jgi:hypothetical protein
VAHRYSRSRDSRCVPRCVCAQQDEPFLVVNVHDVLAAATVHFLRRNRGAREATCSSGKEESKRSSSSGLAVNPDGALVIGDDPVHLRRDPNRYPRPAPW